MTHGVVLTAIFAALKEAMSVRPECLADELSVQDILHHGLLAQVRVFVCDPRVLFQESSLVTPLPDPTFSTLYEESDRIVE